LDGLIDFHLLLESLLVLGLDVDYLRVGILFDLTLGLLVLFGLLLVDLL
jgi:hypothetical protein